LLLRNTETSCKQIVAAGWGAKLGYLGLVLDPQGGPVEVHFFESSELSGHWHRLGEFEGPAIEGWSQVQTANGEVDAWIYVLAPE